MRNLSRIISNLKFASRFPSSCTCLAYDALVRLRLLNNKTCRLDALYKRIMLWECCKHRLYKFNSTNCKNNDINRSVTSRNRIRTLLTSNFIQQFMLRTISRGVNTRKLILIRAAAAGQSVQTSEGSSPRKHINHKAEKLSSSRRPPKPHKTKHRNKRS